MFLNDLEGQFKMSEHTEELAELANKYHGLNTAHLSQVNPGYSCVICADVNCENHMRQNFCCPDHEIATEDEFAKFYSFGDVSK